VSLFRRASGVGDIERHLLTRDVIYVGGGSVLSLLGAWRAHGLDAILRRAWEAGVVLCGGSAGSLCWFSAGVTAFHGAPQRYDGLGLLPWSNCVHYDAEPERDRAYRRMLLDGMRSGYAAEDGSALHFVGTRLARVVASRPGAKAYRMRAAAGRVERRALPGEYLGAAASVAAVA
jgi:peptidase E